MQYVLVNLLVQVLLFVVAVYLVGYIISLINKLFYKCVNGNRAVCYATGIIGTPVHELSHAAMCLIFFHKITEIKLFQIDTKSGTLGYVNHTYRKRNIYQIIGNYFIGVAPVMVGSVILFVLMMFLLPASYVVVSAHIGGLNEVILSGEYSSVPLALLNTVGGLLKGVFLTSLADYKWWIFVVICFCVALHMNLSWQDIKSSLLALPFLIAVLFVLNLILNFASQQAYADFLQFFNGAGCYLVGFLLLSAIFSLAVLIVGGIVQLIRLTVKKIRR